MASLADEAKRIREEEAKARRKALMQKQQKNSTQASSRAVTTSASAPSSSNASASPAATAYAATSKALSTGPAPVGVVRSSAQQRDYLTRGPARNAYEACEIGDRAALEKFVSLGKFNVDAKDATGRTCLHWASENGHVGLIDFLILEHGADIAMRDVHNGRTSIHMAARRGQAKALKYMLTMVPPEKAELLVNEVDARGCTPAFLAYEMGPDGEEAFRLLLDFGARWNALDLEEQMKRVAQSHREIEERRRYEEALRRLEEEQRALSGGGDDTTASLASGSP